MVILSRFSDLAVWSVMVIHLTVVMFHKTIKSLSFVALERPSGGGEVEQSILMGYSQVSDISRETEENAPKPTLLNRRVSKVLKHVRTKFIVNSTSWNWVKCIVEKRRPSGRSIR